MPVTLPEGIRPASACCATCPFRQVDGKDQNPQLAATVRQRVLANQAQQLCHSTPGGGPGGKPGAKTRLCRGGRDFLLTILHRLGQLDAPTDEAWDARATLTQKGPVT